MGTIKEKYSLVLSSLFMLFLAFSVIGCTLAIETVGLAESAVVGGLKRIKDFPEINRSPSLKITLQGYKDPKLELKFGVTFVTTNKECQIPLGVAAQGSQSVTDWMVAKEGVAEFESILILDKYLPGKCGWEAHPHLDVRATTTEKKQINENESILFRLVDVPLDWVGEMNFLCSSNDSFNRETEVVFCHRAGGGRYWDVERKSGVIKVKFDLEDSLN